MTRIWASLWVCMMAVIMTLPLSAQEEESDVAAETVDIDPIVFHLLKRNRPQGLVTIQVSLELHKDTEFTYVYNRRHQVKADLLAASVALFRQSFDVNTPIDPALVAAYLTPVLEQRLGKDKVTLYITKAMITVD